MVKLFPGADGIQVRCTCESPAIASRQNLYVRTFCKGGPASGVATVVFDTAVAAWPTASQK